MCPEPIVGETSHAGKGPSERITVVNDIINGVHPPVPSACERVEVVKRHIPEAQITFDVNPDWSRLFRSASPRIDDASFAEE